MPTSVRSSLIVVVAGLVTGVGTQVLQGVLPGNLGVAANSAGAWAVAALAVGALLPTWRWAVAGGAASLVIASVAYYRAVELLEGIGQGWRSTVLWSVVGLAAGPAFGAAGWSLRRPGRRWLPLALVAGALTAEAIHLWWFVGHGDLRLAAVIELGLATACGAAAVYLAPAPRAQAVGAWTAAVMATALAFVMIDRAALAW